MNRHPLTGGLNARYGHFATLATLLVLLDPQLSSFLSPMLSRDFPELWIVAHFAAGVLATATGWPSDWVAKRLAF
ncbi:MAG: hypothetical protein JO006_11395 [Paucibacter sp.]|nr:hypothetical protein [Roseateles sp.]